MVTRSAHPRPPAPALVFLAIADPTRRAILDGLRAGRRPAGDIAASFRISRPAVCKHLRLLHRARLVRVAKSGRRRYYQLNPAPLAQVAQWLDHYRTMWAARLVAIKSLVESQPPESQPAPPDHVTPPRAGDHA